MAGQQFVESCQLLTQFFSPLKMPYKLTGFLLGTYPFDDVTCYEHLIM